MRRHKDIDIDAVKVHLDKHHKSLNQIKIIRELNDVKNHQAFWVHNEKREREREKMQVDNAPEAQP